MVKKAAAPLPQLPADVPRIAGQITVKLGADVYAKLSEVWQKWNSERGTPITMSDTLRAMVIMVHDLEVLTPLEVGAKLPPLPCGVERVSFPDVVAAAVKRADDTDPPLVQAPPAPKPPTNGKPRPKGKPKGRES